MGKIKIIIQREFNERVRKKSFILTTILTPLLFIGIIVAMIFLANKDSTEVREIMVYDESGIVANKLESNDRLILTTTEDNPELIKHEKSLGMHENLFGILVIGEDIVDNPRNVELFSYKTSTMDLELALSRQIASAIESEKLKEYEIENLPEILASVKTSVSIKSYRVDQAGAETESSSALALVLAYIFGFLIYMFVFIYGAMVMQGVIEEKSSKVLEIIVSSVRPFQLMMGKIIGIAAVAITQFFIWVAIVVAGVMAVTFFLGGDMAAAAEGGMAMNSSLGPMGELDPEAFVAINALTDMSFIGTMLGGFLLYFIGGYLLYAAMFAAIGSAVDNVADTQQLQVPVTIPMVLALIVLLNVMKDPNSSLAVWFSMIPFTSPIIMVARLPYGVPTWEIVTSLVILYLSFMFMVWLAGKIYRVGIFMYGKKPTFKELFKWARYKY